MKSLKYTLKRYFPDLVTTAVALVLAAIAYRYSPEPGTIYFWTTVITLVAAMVILYFRVRERDFYYESLGDRKQRGRWVGYGTFEFSRMDRCFRITGSDSGFLFTRTLSWSDYEFRFRFKILTSCLGVIIRAVNLSNLAMLQINQAGISPHIRVNGAWNRWEMTDAGLEFPEPLDLNEWYDCTMKCDQDSVRIWIGLGEKVICDRSWTIPRGQLHFVLEKEEGSTPAKTIPFSINLEYGTVGFRNDALEEALVREVLVEKIAD